MSASKTQKKPLIGQSRLTVGLGEINLERVVAKIRCHAREMRERADRLTLSANPDDWCNGYGMKIRAFGMETAAQVLMNGQDDL